MQGNLEDAGIDPQRLTAAFAEVDEQGDGELELFEFRDFWSMVFPERPMTETTWRYTEQMFREIDADGSNQISFEEIVNFLQKSLDVEKKRKRRPANIGDWCQVLFCAGSPEWTQPWERGLHYSILLFHFCEYIFTIISVVSLMIESLPDHQHGHLRRYLRGTNGTFVLDTMCVTYFVFHFLGNMVGELFSRYPTTSSTEQKLDTGSPKHINLDDTDTTFGSRLRDYLSTSSTWTFAMSIVPYFVVLAEPDFYHLLPLQVLRLSRVLRILKLVKLGGSQKAPELGPALMKSFMSLWFLFILILIAMCLSASFAFYAETDQSTFVYEQQKWIRDNDSIYDDAGLPIPFQSIPDALWWSIVTLTTVGYGDVSPISIGGKCVAVLTMLGGLIVVGYPITVLTGTFQAMEEERIETEERLERNAELYEGIKAWLAVAELDMDGPATSAQPSRFDMTDTKVSHSPGASREARKDIVIDALSTMQERLYAKLQKLSLRLEHLEKQQKKYQGKSTRALKTIRSSKSMRRRASSKESIKADPTLSPPTHKEAFIPSIPVAEEDGTASDETE
eukprot:Rhum_TRINITY_DN6369_c0_g2::Rhum_TRINITY_DN6369_c0_g2_i1::g.19853::m.19853/K04876/KCNA3; potassium voltage-gated channel Shaker-related subfamily A member 3